MTAQKKSLLECLYIESKRFKNPQKTKNLNSKIGKHLPKLVFLVFDLLDKALQSKVSIPKG